MRARFASSPRDLAGVVDAAELRLHAWSARYSITLLRLSLGFVFVLFGVLKFFPNLSPAQGIAEDTTHKLFLGILPDAVNLRIVAVLEVSAGICLLSGRYVRAAAVLLLVEMAGILSPIVLLPGMLFGGPHHLPNLLGQYILKDVVLLSAVLVLLAVQRGGRLTPGPDAAALVAGSAATDPVVADHAAGPAVPALAPGSSAHRAPTTAPGRAPDSASRPRPRDRRARRRLGTIAAGLAVVAVVATVAVVASDDDRGSSPAAARVSADGIRLVLVGPGLLTGPARAQLRRAVPDGLSVRTSPTFLEARLALRKGDADGVLVLRPDATQKLYSASSTDPMDLRDLRDLLRDRARLADEMFQSAALPSR